MAADYGKDLVWVDPLRKWFYWSGCHWAKDDRLAVHSKVKEWAEGLNREAREAMEKEPDPRRVQARIKYAKHSRGHCKTGLAVGW
jgi:hypothetical protein